MENQGSVSGCVTSLIASFSNGLNVFKKLRKQRHRKKRRVDLESQELCLTNSLRQGKEDIQREYEKSIHTGGRPFAVGDAVAQTSLAEILLNLNAGLVGIISSFLKRDKNSEVPLDYSSLTTLSEVSRVGACKVLRQLLRRCLRPNTLSSTRLPISPQAAKENDRNAFAVERTKRKRSRAFAKAAKNGTPVLARVVIQNSSQPPQIAKVKPRERRIRSSSSSNLATSKLSAAKTPPLPYDKPEKREREPAMRHDNTTLKSKSMTDIKAIDTEQPRRPPVPPQNQEQLGQAMPLPRRQNKSTPTYYSVRSDQTKLGEIPLHLWAVQPDFEAMSLANREAEIKGWPVGHVRAQGAGENTGKRRFFGLFGRRKTNS